VQEGEGWGRFGSRACACNQADGTSQLTWPVGRKRVNLRAGGQQGEVWGPARSNPTQLLLSTAHAREASTKVGLGRAAAPSLSLRRLRLMQQHAHSPRAESTHGSRTPRGRPSSPGGSSGPATAPALGTGTGLRRERAGHTQGLPCRNEWPIPAERPSPGTGAGLRREPAGHTQAALQARPTWAGPCLV